MNPQSDLLIIGAGDLGSRVAKIWRDKHPSAEILGETRTNASHAKLSLLNITPIVAGTKTRSFSNVVFCVPPSGFLNYSDAVATATKRVLPEGRFVFTSSTSVYGNVGFANEHTPTTNTGHAARLFYAEKAALSSPAGVVIRLSGMYHLNRDKIKDWIPLGEAPGSEESSVNLVHYDDAADAVVRLLMVEQLTERVFLAATKNNITKGEYVDIAMKHPRYESKRKPRFLNDAPVRSKRLLDNSLTRTLLGWKPKFETFADYMEEELRTYGKGMLAS